MSDRLVTWKDKKERREGTICGVVNKAGKTYLVVYGLDGHIYEVLTKNINKV